MAQQMQIVRERGLSSEHDILNRDLFYTVRQFLKNPGFALVAVLTLALPVAPQYWRKL
jgi:hypothetical protein